MSGTKHPGSVVGDDWDELSTRNPAQIKEWWPTGTDRGIALHVGKSGGFAFDLDRPQNVAPWLWSEFEGAPFLWTSEKQQRRHVLFLMPAGRMLGSGLGAFRGQGWGEVRGKNGVIAVYPTVHPDQINPAEAKDPSDLGRYALGRAGELSALPETLSKMLNDASDAVESIETDTELDSFLDEHSGSREPWGLNGAKAIFENRDKLQRHPSMVDALCMAFREAIIGRFPARQAYDELQQMWVLAFELEDGRRPAADEFRSIAKWCAAQALAADPAETRAKVDRGVDEAAFWGARPFLMDLQQMARARRVGPWAMFGVEMARAVAAVPPWAVLPPLVGSHASLNLFVALVGPSGFGKGAAEQAAHDFLDTDPIVDTATVGSGEGIAKLFAHKVKGEQVNERNAVLFTVPEVDNLTALGSRQGATLLPQLRMAWSGERLGFSYADPTKTVRIERHRYRLNLVLGVQPERAGPLLDDADGGTPQRFLWFPTTDPDAPEDPPEAPGRWCLPRWPERERAANIKFAPSEVQLLPIPVTPGSLFEVGLPDEAVQFVREAQLAKLRGTGQGAGIEGHAALARLKAAAALMILDGRHDKITDEDWRLAGVVMEISNRTRADVEHALAEKAGRENLRRGRAEGTRAVAAAEITEESAVKRVCVNIKKHIAALDPERQGVTLPAFRRRIAERDRELVDDALQLLLDVGSVEELAGEKGPLYRLAEAGP